MSEFTTQLLKHRENVLGKKDLCRTEEATKQCLILPFVQLLGYDIYDPREVIAELDADIEGRKGDRVDYGININGNIEIIIECKKVNETLNLQHAGQLKWYFANKNPKIGILTNGIVYQFYSDTDKDNNMDAKPFLEINILNTSNHIAELEKFTKENYNPNSISEKATHLRYQSLIKSAIEKEFSDPSVDFVKHFAKICANGRISSKFIDIIKPILISTIKNYINTNIKEKIDSINSEISKEENRPENNNGIVTTEEELESFHIVKAICSNALDPTRITWRDRKKHFSVLLDDNFLYHVCKFLFDRREKVLRIDTETGTIDYPVEQPADLYKYKQEILQSAKRQLALKDHKVPVTA